MATYDYDLALFGDPVPDDAFVTSYQAMEAISLPYQVRVVFSTGDMGCDVSKCLRSRLLLRVRNTAGEERFFDGVPDEVGLVKVDPNRLHFFVRLRPALSALAHRENCRIFQDQSVVDIARTLFDEAGFGDRVDWKLRDTYQPRPFVVQFRESELNFVSRLFEDWGIFYYFTHDQEGHRMVVTDSPEVMAEGEGVLLSAWSGLGGTASPVRRLSRTRSLRTTEVHLRDFDFEKPGAPTESKQGAEDAWSLPYFEYPAGFTDGNEGSMLARACLSRLRAEADVLRGESSALRLNVGQPLRVEGQEEPDFNDQFVVIGLVTLGSQRPPNLAHQDPRDQQSHSCDNAFVAIPRGAPFAPARRATRPRIHGIQTAVVTSASNEEEGIHVDQYGRIKVRFHWDRINQQNDTASCWMRVGQVPTGGSMVLPRIGWEVSVAFLDGDPDRPLVLGRLYNSASMPPMDLPASKASGCLKSNSSPGGGGCNEISFGDSGGSQGFGVKAQKDFNITIGHDCSENVAVDDEHHVNANMNRTIGSNEILAVTGNQTVDVGKNYSINVTGAQKVSITGNDQSNATGNYVEKTAAHTHTVNGNQLSICNGFERTIDGPITRKIGAVQAVLTGGSVIEKVSAAHTTTVGAIRAHLVTGSHGETVGAAKTQTCTAAELHMTKGDLAATAGAASSTMAGGVHVRKIKGNLIVSAPLITVAGAVGALQGGKTKLALSGGPISIKGSKISVKTALIKRTGGTMKKG